MEILMKPTERKTIENIEIKVTPIEYMVIEQSLREFITNYYYHELDRKMAQRMVDAMENLDKMN